MKLNNFVIHSVDEWSASACAVAYHEIGHAIVALYYNIPVHNLQVFNTTKRRISSKLLSTLYNGSLGVTFIPHEYNVTPSEEMVQVFMAGRVAEITYTCTTPSIRGSQSDLMKMEDMLEELGFSGDTYYDKLAELRLKTLSILNTYTGIARRLCRYILDNAYLTETFNSIQDLESFLNVKGY